MKDKKQDIEIDVSLGEAIYDTTLLLINKRLTNT